MKISVLIGTRNRAAPLLRCLGSIAAQRQPPHEVIVLDDASDRIRVADVLAATANGTGARVVRSDTQLGVGRGRNRLFREAAGDVFLFLDDDAYLEDPEFLGRLAGELASRPRAGILAAGIVDHRDGETRLLAPFPRKARAMDPAIVDRARLVSYFLGGGHAVRREVYERVGGYDEAFVWGEEELDLSFRAINAGFEISYVPELTVHHQAEPPVLRSPGQRSPELFYHVRNRFILARKYLPARYVAAYLSVWVTRYAADALRTADPGSLARGVVEGLMATVARETLTAAAVSYLRNNHGRLWY